MIEVARGQTSELSPARGRSARAWRWQSILAALLALLVVEGQPAAAFYATTGLAGPAGSAEQRAAIASRTQVPTAPTEVVAPTGNVAPAGTAAKTGAVARDARPDVSVSFTGLDDAQAGQRFTYTLQLRNDGGAVGAVVVSTALPPQLSNVRVTAPGFVCTRHFSASGPQAGTLVSCMRNDLESGGTADVVVEANAPSTAGPVHLVATADPRDEIAESDEENNEADATVQVRG